MIRFTVTSVYRKTRSSKILRTFLALHFLIIFKVQLYFFHNLLKIAVIGNILEMTPRKETPIATRQAVINMRENGMRGTEIAMVI